MKILLVIDQFNSENNGTTISTVRFAKALHSNGHDVRILTTGKSSANNYIVPERKLPVASLLAKRQGLTFGKPVKSILTEAINDCDIVHFLMPFKLSISGLKIAKKLGKPYTAAFHVQAENVTYNIGMGDCKCATSFVYSYFKNRFYKNVTHIHCPSNFIATELRRNKYKGKLHVVSNGVDKKFMPGPDTRPEELKDKIIISMVGRLSSEKRQDVLINAVWHSKYRDKIQLVFAGNGPKANHYHAISQKLPIKPVFGFYQQPELIKILQYSDLYVHSADVEIEAIACIEAISCGLVPIISNSPMSATKQFALDEKSLFQAGNARDLAKKIDYFIEHDDEKIELSKKYIGSSKKFLLENCIKQIENMFEEAIHDSKQRDL